MKSTLSTKLLADLAPLDPKFNFSDTPPIPPIPEPEFLGLSITIWTFVPLVIMTITVGILILRKIRND